MFKNFKSVSMLLFLSAIGGGTVYAVSGESVTGNSLRSIWRKRNRH